MDWINRRFRIFSHGTSCFVYFTFYNWLWTLWHLKSKHIMIHTFLHGIRYGQGFLTCFFIFPFLRKRCFLSAILLFRRTIVLSSFVNFIGPVTSSIEHWRYFVFIYRLITTVHLEWEIPFFLHYYQRSLHDFCLLK